MREKTEEEKNTSDSGSYHIASHKCMTSSVCMEKLRHIVHSLLGTLYMRYFSCGLRCVYESCFPNPSWIMCVCVCA